MVVIFPYRVNRALYFLPETVHTIELLTTEYTCRNDLLVHLRLGKNLGIRLNNIIRYEVNKAEEFQNEQFLYKKKYQGEDAKPVTRSAFDEKMSHFDMGQTVIEREMLEQYAYTDKNGKSASVQIVVREKGVDMTASIDFRDAEQFTNFICPAWLTPMDSGHENLDAAL